MTTAVSVTTERTPTRRIGTSVLRRIPAVSRFALGALFFVCGLDGFLHFLPPPTGPMPEGAVAFGGALAQTGYMLPLIKGTELVCGVLLLAGRFVPLALVMLAPVLVNIALFHAILAPDGSGVAALAVALAVHLAWTHRAAFRPLLRAKAGVASS